MWPDFLLDLDSPSDENKQLSAYQPIAPALLPGRTDPFTTMPVIIIVGSTSTEIRRYIRDEGREIRLTLHSLLWDDSAVISRAAL